MDSPNSLYSEEMMKNGRLFTFPLLVSLVLCGAVVAQNASASNANAPKVVADVGGEKILEADLAEECLRQHGTEELKDVIKKYLIQLECQRLKITVTQQEVNNEVARMAGTFKFSTEEWLELLEKERGITKEQYMADIIWPILAINKIGGAKLNVSEEEIQKEFNARFGPAVQVRQILLHSRAEAERVLAEVRANPEAFASIAKNRSQDPASKPYGGLLQPIRRHTVHSSLEQVVFALNPGEVSPIVEHPVGCFFIYRCEQHLQPQNIDIAKVREQLVMKARDVKIRAVAEEVFTDLQHRATINVVFGNPEKSAQFPGVAAVVNGQTISRDSLASRCLKLYGKTVLNEMISKKIIDIDCRKQGVTITEADLDAEIREMAMLHTPLKPDGQPNIELYLRIATQDFKTSLDVHRGYTVWPMLALKRLSRNMIQITEDDLRKSFEANFGAKVRCLAIVLDARDQRRALDVWELANRHRTQENFGDLAEKYSADPETRVGRGVVPPIARHCGQLKLEQEAFSLKPGEISQIVQVDDSLVILYCLGIEPPAITDINEVRQDLITDIFSKKEKLAIAQYYEGLLAQTAVDNYLTGESRNPGVEQALQQETIQR